MEMEVRKLLFVGRREVGGIEVLGEVRCTLTFSQRKERSAWLADPCSLYAKCKGKLKNPSESSNIR